MLRRAWWMLLLALTVLAPDVLAQNPNPSFNLVNRSGRVIERVFASPSGDNSWGVDRLGQNVLAADRSLPIRLPADGNCDYDVRVDYQGGGSDEQRRVNTCNIVDVIFGRAGNVGTGGSVQQGGQQQAGTENPSFNLVNQTGRVIERAYASPSGDNTWGQDRLGRNVLASGRRIAIRLPSDGNCEYDVRVEYQGGGSDERRRVNTCAVSQVVFGGTARAPAAGGGQAAGNDPSFRLVNRTGRTIERAFASPSADNNWGQDRLGQHLLPNGRYLTIRLPADGNCEYDVRVIYQGGGEDEQRRLNTCARNEVVFGSGGGAQPQSQPQRQSQQQQQPLIQQQQGNDPSFRLVNRSDRRIDAVFATPVGQDSWGSDLLGRQEVIQPGATRVVRLPAGGACDYDIRIVYADSSAAEKRRVDLCNTTDLAFP